MASAQKSNPAVVIVAAPIAIPSAVGQAIRATLKGTFGIITASAAWANVVGLDKFEPAPMARACHEKFPEMSEKTLKNYFGTGLALAKAHTLILTKFENDAKAYGAWLEAETKKLGYTKSEPDLQNFLAGRLSVAGKKKADEEQKAKNASAAAEAAAAPTLGVPEAEPVKADDTEPVKVEPISEPIAQSPTNAALPEPLRIVSVTRDSTGGLHMAINEATDLELDSIVSMLQVELLKRSTAPVAAPVAAPMVAA